MRDKPVCLLLSLMTFHHSVVLSTFGNIMTPSSSHLDLTSLEKLSQQLIENGMKYRSSSQTPGEETKQCLNIFLELGQYLLRRISRELEEGNGREETGGNVKDPSLEEKSGIVENDQDNASLQDGHTNVNQAEKVQSPPTPHYTTRTRFLNQRPGLSFPCNECRFVAPSLVVLKGHKKLNHLKEHCKICIKCGYENFDINEFKKHLKIVHPKNEKITQYRNN